MNTGNTGLFILFLLNILLEFSGESNLTADTIVEVICKFY